MRSWCLLIAMVAISIPVYSEERLLPRALDAWASETLERAVQHSMLVRQMVDTLDGANVVVHVETSPVMLEGVAGMTRFVGAGGGYRYLRITLARALTPHERAVILGHELQHACEFAESGALRTEDLRKWYQSVAVNKSSRDFFETRQAIEAGRRVSRELTRRLKLELPTETLNCALSNCQLSAHKPSQ